MKKKLFGIFMTVCMLFTCASIFVGCSKDTRIPINFLLHGAGTVQDNNLHRRMIKAWEDKPENAEYRVNIVTNPNSNWDAGIEELAASKKMPHIFNTFNIGSPLNKGWARNITEIFGDDEDFLAVPDPLREAAMYNGNVYAVPTSMSLDGYFVNDALLELAGLDPEDLPCNPTLKQFNDAIDALARSAASNQFRVMTTVGGQFTWKPSAIQADMRKIDAEYKGTGNAPGGWKEFVAKHSNIVKEDDEYQFFMWDPNKQVYHLNSPLFAETLDYMRDIRSAGTLEYDVLDADGKAAIGLVTNEGAGAAFREGKVALYYGKSYERKGITYNGNEMVLNTARFIGAPGGRNVIIPDLFCISSSITDEVLLEKSIDLVKWMTFSPDGIKTRLDLDAAGGKNEFTSLPISKDPEVVAKYFANEPLEGLQEVFNSLDNAIVEPLKGLPSFAQVRFHYILDGISYDVTIGNADPVKRENPNISTFLGDCWMGGVTTSSKWADMGADLNRALNNEHKAIKAVLDELYPPSL